MFENLLETKRKRERGAGGALFSVVFHCATIAAALTLTAKGVVEAHNDQREQTVKMDIKKEPPPPETKPPPPEVVHTPPPPKGYQIITAPVEIPDVLPKIDLSKKMTDDADFTGKGAVGGTSKGVEGGVAKPLQSEALYEFQVEKQAAWVNGTGAPTYPEILKSAGIEGEVQATFVIDTTGRADPSTFKVLNKPDQRFINAVIKSLPSMRFLPAEAGGRKVKQHVQQTFQFTVKG